MKRCRSWLLLYAALIGTVGHVSALRATSLIFGKQLTTTKTTGTTAATTSTTIGPVNDVENITVAEESADNTNSTKPVLTGIPQIDYIWDPNLPRELNGYNLTNYPFLPGVPATEEEIGFKCEDALHDGFYASIKWNCQLYHHCIHGIRYDFLCANFTAFDQKTFICHFVSEVDCKNSAKYWFRNDALYVATTTTTTKAPVTQPSISATPARPYGGRPRRPLRRRPQIDYYEEDYADDYEDPPPPPPRLRKNQKPRNRRPDFDDYTVNSRGSIADEDLYEARPVPNSERNRNRQDDDYAYQRPANRNRNKPNRRKPQYDYEDPPVHEQEKRRRPNVERRKIVDDEEIVERRPVANDRRKYNEERRVTYEEDVPPKRQYDDDYEDRPLRKNNKLPSSRDDIINEAPQVKPASSGSSGGGIATLFNNPRKAPKISRPVPLNEKKKFEYTPNKAGQSAAVDDTEYYDDYVEPPQRPRGNKPQIKEAVVKPEDNTNKRAISNNRPSRLDPKPFKRPAAPITNIEYEEDYEELNSPPIKRRTTPGNEDEERKRPVSNNREKASSPAPPSTQSQQQSPPGSRNRFKDPEEYVEPEKKLFIRDKHNDKSLLKSPEAPLILKKDNYNIQSGAPDYRDYTNRQQDNEKYVNVDREIGNNRNTNNNNKQQKLTIRTPYEEREEEREIRPIVRVVKRPFLPSRGGSPYLPRGLQPVGNNARPFDAANIPKNGGFNIEVDSKESTHDYEEEQPHEKTQSIAKRKPTLDEIYDSEYDVTLNDALNPTLKPLTSHNNRYPSTSYSELTYAPSHIRRSHLNPPITLASLTNRKQSRIPVAIVDSYEDDYDY